MYFRYLVIISPWKRAEPFIWMNLNPFSQGCFVPSLVEIGPGVLEKKILNFVNVFSLFDNYLLLEKGGVLHLNKLESPSPKDALCQVWLKLPQWLWRRRWNVKVYGRTMDKLCSEKLTWAFDSGELKRKQSVSRVETRDLKFRVEEILKWHAI